MKESLFQLFQQVIEKTNEKEKTILKELLERYENYIGSDEPYLGRLLGMQKNVTDSNCEITIPISEIIHNHLGIVHGGITATLLDSVMGTIASHVAPDGHGAVTSNLNIHYIAPGKGDSLTAVANVIHKGTKTIVVEGEVYLDNRKKIAHATGTFFIVKIQ
ncbi:PaaI family thioesterase [Bacillus smithii]|uniref:PaaI family thioesterase n=1 Tax=Bacillus smithii TaxID=1479 RepID=UPI003D25B29E